MKNGGDEWRKEGKDKDDRNDERISRIKRGSGEEK